MDPPAPPSDQVRHTQVGGGEIPVWNTMKTMKTRPFKGNDNNEPLCKRSHKATSRREHKLRNGNSWQGPGPCPYTDNVGTEQSALPTTCNSVDEMSDDAFKDMMKSFAAENFGSMLNSPK